MHFGSDSAGYGFSQTKWKKRSATSRLHPRLQSKTIKAVGPIEERPGGRVGLPLILYPSRGENESYGRSQERECLRWPGIESGDHLRPQMFCTECAGDTLDGSSSEGQWSVSYTQVSFATE